MKLSVKTKIQDLKTEEIYVVKVRKGLEHTVVNQKTQEERVLNQHQLKKYYSIVK